MTKLIEGISVFLGIIGILGSTFWLGMLFAGYYKEEPKMNMDLTITTDLCIEGTVYVLVTNKDKSGFALAPRYVLEDNKPRLVLCLEEDLH